MVPVLAAALLALAPLPHADGLRKYRSREANVKSNAPPAAAKAVGARIDFYCELFERFYAELGLDKKNDNELKIRLFATHAEFEEFWERSTSAGGGAPLAFFSPGLNSVVMYDDPEDVALRAVVFHECSHQYLNRYTYDAPSWLNEGLAEYFEGWKVVDGVSGTRRPHLFDLSLVRRAVASGDFLSPRELVELPAADFRDFRERRRPGLHPYLHYATAWSFVHYLLESGYEDDREVLVDYLRELNSKGPAARFEVEDWERLTARWKDHLERLDAEPTDATDHFLLGSGHRENREWKEAAEEFRAALELDPALPEARHWLAYCLKRGGRYADATAAFEEVRRERPDDPRPSYWLARIQLGIDARTDDFEGPRDAEQALLHAQRASELADGKEPLYLWLEARCLLALGRGKEAARLAGKLPRLADEDEEERWKELADAIREEARASR